MDEQKMMVVEVVMMARMTFVILLMMVGKTSRMAVGWCW